jgi:hypothetical protein
MNTSGTNSSLLNSNNLIMTDITNTITNTIDSTSITSNSDLTITSVNLNANTSTNVTLNSIGLGNINLNAPNINSYNYALPICFNKIINSTFSYTTGGQAFQNVYNTTFSIPFQFFVDSTNAGYTSTTWKIDFDMNTWSGVNMSDNGFAIYIDFVDQNSNTYTPYLYNLSTPFCRWSNRSTWSGATNELQSINWTDIIDFAGLSGTTGSNLPLVVNMYIAGDGAISATFNWKLGLTRTNLI